MKCVARCVLLRCSLLFACCLLVSVSVVVVVCWYSLYIICRSSFAVCCFLFAGLLIVDWCLLFVV